MSAVPVLANRLIVPNLRGLLLAHPGLRVEVSAEGANVRFRHREADLAIRLARPNADRALCRRVGALSYSVYAPAGAGAAGATLPWVTYDDAHADLPQARWLAARSDGGAGIAGGLRVADAETMLAAVRAGPGGAAGRRAGTVASGPSRRARAAADAGSAWLVDRPMPRHRVR